MKTNTALDKNHEQIYNKTWDRREISTVMYLTIIIE